MFYYRNLLRGYDVNRELIVEIVGLLRKVLGEVPIHLLADKVTISIGEVGISCIALK